MSGTSIGRAVLKHLRRHIAQTRLQLSWWELFFLGVYGTLCEQVYTPPCAGKPTCSALVNHTALAPYWLAEEIDAWPALVFSFPLHAVNHYSIPTIGQKFISFDLRQRWSFVIGLPAS